MADRDDIWVLSDLITAIETVELAGAQGSPSGRRARAIEQILNGLRTQLMALGTNASQDQDWQSSDHQPGDGPPSVRDMLQSAMDRPRLSYATRATIGTAKSLYEHLSSASREG